MKNLSRREAFGAIMGAAVAGGALLSITPSFDAHAEKSKFPWIYQKLDKNAVAEKAYWDFYEEGRGGVLRRLRVNSRGFGRQARSAVQFFSV
jgi:hypothetical protein